MTDDNPRPAPVLSEAQAARFWGLWAAQPSGCIEWQGCLLHTGYGRIKVNGEAWLAHRLMVTLLVRPLARSEFVCHHCDNPPCGRLDHLFIGTSLDNNRDSARKGRAAVHRYPERYRAHHGETNGFARLTDEVVMEIRRRYKAGGISQQRLGDEYGVSQSAVGRAIAGQTWGHVPEAAA